MSPAPREGRGDPTDGSGRTNKASTGEDAGSIMLHTQAPGGGGVPPESLLRPQRKQPRARPESDLTPCEKWFYLMVITGPPESLRV